MEHEFRDKWYLMYSSFPDLNWARLRIFESQNCEIFDCDGKIHQFDNLDEALYWLAEDEFTAFSDLDSDDEQEYGISISRISIPNAQSELELRSKMFIKSNLN
jgi:hypothetical protein